MTLFLTRFRRAYGAHPLQLVLVLASFVVVGYVVQVLGVARLYDRDVWWQSIGLWFLGAAIGHDLVLFPIYAAVDRAATAVTRTRSSARRRTRAVPVTNYVRLPLLACGLLTLMFFPGVIRQGAGAYHRATGQTQEPFLLRWLILCAAILALGALAYVIARVVAGRQPPLAVPDVSPTAPASPSARPADPPFWAVVAALLLAAVVALRRRGSGGGERSR